ncbi:MAG: nuclease-related domain-containing protein, partial [Candidatus Poribacteria bacterium]|nr:nuclease-related domain-containing protein [Candidatus Poribacteria bacterium]
RWNLDNLKKGVDAETRVGKIIERAITANNCAVAHSVIEISKIGDIDHIVATPVAVWVIETKYQRVPQERFPKVLDRIAANMNAVRQWAPDRTTVRGCLVLAYENESVKKSRWGTNDNGGKEEIAVYARSSLDTFEQEMRKEAGKTPSLDQQVAEELWRLDSATNSEHPHGSDQT